MRGEYRLRPQPRATRSPARGRSRIEGNEPGAGKIDLGPGMGVARANRYVPAVGLGTAVVAGDVARRDARRPQEDDHRAREELAMSLLGTEEEVRDRIVLLGAQVARVRQRVRE